MPEINFHLGDCMDFMRGKPDNYYDLAVVDPPYGGGGGKGGGAPFSGGASRFGGRFNRY
jgi:DNA modification methylase